MHLQICNLYGVRYFSCWNIVYDMHNISLCMIYQGKVSTNWWIPFPFRNTITLQPGHLTTLTNITANFGLQNITAHFSWSNESQFPGSAIEEVNSSSNFHIPLKLSRQPILVFWEILMHTSMWKGSKFLLVVFIEEAGTWKCALAHLLLRVSTSFSFWCSYLSQ